MRQNRRRAYTLRRVFRLREIEGAVLQRELSEARAQEDRMRGLQLRTQTMASEYSDCRGSVDGGEIVQRTRLAKSLSDLGEQTSAHVIEAATNGDRISANLTRLDHQKERITDRIGELEKADAVEQTARAAEDANTKATHRHAGLARRLL